MRVLASCCRDAMTDGSRHSSTFPKSLKPPGSPTYAHSDYELRPVSRLTPYQDCSCSRSDDFSWHDTALTNTALPHSGLPHHHSHPALAHVTPGIATHPVLAHRTDLPFGAAVSMRPHCPPPSGGHKRLTRYQLNSSSPASGLNDSSGSYPTDTYYPQP